MKRVGGGRRWSVLVGFEPCDLWIGVYWNREKPSGFIVDVLDIYVCIIPTLVLRLNRSVTALDVQEANR